MSRFNPGLEKSPEDWGALALRDNLSDRSGHLIVAGIVGGGLVASGTTPLLGLVVAAYCVVKGVQSAFASDKNKKLITQNGCIAHVLKPSDFRAYCRQVGHEKVMEELQFAEEEGMSLTADAWEFFEEFVAKNEQQQQALPPATTSVGIATKMQAINVPSKAVVDRYDPMSNTKIDIISEMSLRISNTLIIGIPGSGKGMLVANAIRSAKRKHPHLKIFVVDPKADQKESGYFASCDVVKAYACMDASPSTVAAWAEAAMNEYANFARQNERTLLIVDEGTLLGTKLNQAKSTLLVDKLTSLASGGDSAGRNVWFMMQSPYVTGASLNLSTTSQMTSIVIAFSENIGALAQWKSAKVFRQLSLDEVSDLIDNSETGRAIYYGKTGRWYIMPPLTNHSSYDRDKREYLQGREPKDTEFSETKTDSTPVEIVESNEKETDSKSSQTSLFNFDKGIEALRSLKGRDWMKLGDARSTIKPLRNATRDTDDVKLLISFLEKDFEAEFRSDGYFRIVNKPS